MRQGRVAGIIKSAFAAIGGDPIKAITGLSVSDFVPFGKLGAETGNMIQIRYAVVLNSRQTLQPSNRFDWIKRSQEAVKWAQENGFGLISSVGVPSWEVITALGSTRLMTIKLVIPINEPGQFIERAKWVTDQFDLQAHLVRFIPCLVEESGKSQRRPKSERDSMILSQAELIVPVSIRPRGLLEELIGRQQKAGTEIEDQFRTKYLPRSEPLAYTLEGLDLNPALHKLGVDHVVHWTRACNGPWPDELLIDYYRDILSSPRYPRLAIDSLKHILETGVIRASNRNLPADTRAISFSSAKPSELVRLVKWRARRRLMSFEPYGIGFDQELAERIGIKSVVYYDKEVGPPESDVAPWQLQSQGTITNWRNEKESRLPRDLRLYDLPKEKMILFCLMADEAKQLSSSHGIKAVSFLP